MKTKSHNNDFELSGIIRKVVVNIQPSSWIPRQVSLGIIIVDDNNGVCVYAREKVLQTTHADLMPTHCQASFRLYNSLSFIPAGIYGRSGLVLACKEVNIYYVTFFTPQKNIERLISGLWEMGNTWLTLRFSSCHFSLVRSSESGMQILQQLASR